MSIVAERQLAMRAKRVRVITLDCLLWRSPSRMKLRKRGRTCSRWLLATCCELSSTLSLVRTFLSVTACIGLTRADYPLPPGEEKTEVLRIVVRESMCLDLLDRLISDICTATEYLLANENAGTLSTWQTFAVKSLEKEHSSLGSHSTDDVEPKRPMEEGVHRATC
jgi:hypothetical protein